MISWRLAHFEELSPREVHDILQARLAVFVVEQACVFQDVDGVDPACWHLTGIARDALGPHSRPEDNRGRLHGDEAPPSAGASRLVAYCRLVPPGVKYVEPSIGRVLTMGRARRSGAGREMMRRALEHAQVLWPGKALRIGAQRYLERFYGEFGFVTASAPYDEDGIEHVEMVRAPAALEATSARAAGQHVE